MNGVSAAEFAATANDYALHLDHQGQYDVSRLLFIAHRYKPLFIGNDVQIT